MVLLESPTNPLLKIADIQGISHAVHAASPVSSIVRGILSDSIPKMFIFSINPHQSALVVVDNTMMSPYLQRPLNLGADIVYDSGTKYLSGHHDLMAGIIAVERDEVAKVSWRKDGCVFFSGAEVFGILKR